MINTYIPGTTVFFPFDPKDLDISAVSSIIFAFADNTRKCVVTKEYPKDTTTTADGIILVPLTQEDTAAMPAGGIAQAQINYNDMSVTKTLETILRYHPTINTEFIDGNHPSVGVFSEINWKELDFASQIIQVNMTVSGVPDGSVTEEKLAPAVKQQLAEVPVLKQDLTSLHDSVYSLSLGYEDDGLLYIHMNGIPIGDGVEVGDRPEPFYAFVADWESGSPKATQFYTWEGRDYGNAIIDSMSNIRCENGTMILKNKYDASRQRWINQMVTTGGIFESDDFTLTFKAKFDGTAGSWQNVITYGTGTHWTNGTYSDAVKWPAGGEIDAFEQVGGYSDNPNTFNPGAHWGAGTNSGYPLTHEAESAAPGVRFDLPVNVWADYKFSLHDGVYTVYVNNRLIATHDVSEKTVSNNYLWDYHPFIKPQAFYIDGACASSNSKTDKNHEFVFEVKDFKIMQKENVSCTALEIFPQMWERGTNLVFPVGAEIYFDRIYTPANVSNKACEWESSDPTVATVNQGYVSVKKVGNTTITARCGSASASYNLVCSANASVPCVGITIDRSEMTSDVPFSITNYVYPRFSNDTVTWESDDTSIATVENGTVTPTGSGDCYITARCGSASARCLVHSSFVKTPYLSYNILECNIDALVDNPVPSDTIVIQNHGTGGSDYDLTSRYQTTTYDSTGAYRPDSVVCAGLIDTTLSNPIDLTSGKICYVYKGVAWVSVPSGMSDTSKFKPKFEYVQNGNTNHMPGLTVNGETIEIKYGNINTQTVSLTSKTNIVIYYDLVNVYLYVNGVLIHSSKGRQYLASNIAKLKFNFFNGENFDGMDLYIGSSFTEEELIALSTYVG